MKILEPEDPDSPDRLLMVIEADWSHFPPVVTSGNLSQKRLNSNALLSSQFLTPEEYSSGSRRVIYLVTLPQGLIGNRRIYSFPETWTYYPKGADFNQVKDISKSD